MGEQSACCSGGQRGPWLSVCAPSARACLMVHRFTRCQCVARCIYPRVGARARAPAPARTDSRPAGRRCSALRSRLPTGACTPTLAWTRAWRCTHTRARPCCAPAPLKPPGHGPRPGRLHQARRRHRPACRHLAPSGLSARRAANLLGVPGSCAAPLCRHQRRWMQRSVRAACLGGVPPTAQ